VPRDKEETDSAVRKGPLITKIKLPKTMGQFLGPPQEDFPTFRK
jgi:hypothetical protein